MDTRAKSQAKEALYSSDELKSALPASCYLDEAHYKRERESIFFHDWFCVGRSEQIASQGDYLHVDVTGERILVVRDENDEIAAFFNVCSHRGAELVSSSPNPEPAGGPSGCFGRSIVCPYHAWTYELGGRLRGASFLKFSEDRPRSEYGLRTIPVAQWGGFIFLNVNGANAESAQSLEEQIRAPAERIKRYGLADLRIAKRLVYEVAANWKLIAENYNECYHCGPVHPELCELVPLFKKAGGAHLDWSDGIPHREGAWTFTQSGTSDRAPFPGLNDAEKTRHKGELIYPNLMISLAAEHAAVFTLFPEGPAATRIVCDFLFHPDEIEKPTFDPSDVVDFWDPVNWQDWKICESVQRGMGSKGFRAGLYAPMEDDSADVQRYVAARMKDSE